MADPTREGTDGSGYGEGVGGCGPTAVFTPSPSDGAEGPVHTDRRHMRAQSVIFAVTLKFPDQKPEVPGSAGSVVATVDV